MNRIDHLMSNGQPPREQDAATTDEGRKVISAYFGIADEITRACALELLRSLAERTGKAS